MPSSDSVRGRIPIELFKARCGAVACKKSKFIKVTTRDLVINNKAIIKDLCVTGIIDASNGLNITGDIDVTGKITTKDLCVTNDVEISGDLTVTGETKFQESVDIEGCLSACQLEVCDDVDIGGDLTVEGDAELGCVEACCLCLCGEIESSSSATFEGDISSGGTGTFAQSVVTKDVCSSGNLFIGVEELFGTGGVTGVNPGLNSAVTMVGTTGAADVEGDLCDGSKDGQVLYIIGNGINPTAPYVLNIDAKTTVLGQTGTITFDADGDSAKFIWYDGSWVLLDSNL